MMRLQLLVYFIPLLIGTRSSFPEEGFLATSFFNVTASSTCGLDTPLTIDVLNCSAEDHPPEFSVDGDLNTWWQSQENDDPAVITFSLKHDVSLVLVGLRLHIRNPAPQFYAIEVFDRYSNLNGDFIFVFNGSLCSQQTGPCSEFSSVNNSIEISIPAVSSIKPLQSFRLLVSNYSAMENYHTLAEVAIYAKIAPGFYTPSLLDIRVEGELGTLMSRLDHPSSVMQNSSTEQFPSFTGRGYAVLTVPATERVVGQWIFPSLPAAAQYQILLLYSNNNRKSRRLDVVIDQNDISINNLFVDINGSCSRCIAVVSNSPQSPNPVTFSFTSDMLTIDIVLTAVDILLDSIIAVPLAFAEYEGLLGSGSENQIITNISSNQFRAQQLSLEFYNATYACACTTSDLVCDPTGGQCPCDAPAVDGFTTPRGRTCNQCSLQSFLTENGCKECSCPENSTSCDVRTGQCDNCPAFSFGPTCEQCIPNSYNDNGTCQPCECNALGTAYCNITTGECLCKEGVGGQRCSECIDGYFNFSNTGCASCNCGLGSINTSCDGTGRCNCRVGVVGQKCSECSNGFYSLSALGGCLECQCSGRSNNCGLALNSTISSPQENCTCPFPYTGLSCGGCITGYFMSSVSNSCELCQCNGRADECMDETGVCINCRNNTTGPACGQCSEGTYNVADSVADLSCQECPCSSITAFNSSCTLVDGVATCYCRRGHEGPQCSTCANGFFGSPPSLRCTDCSCNGNIDTTVVQACDPTTGICLACTNNATGPECEFCRDGFFGDATTQSCQPCGCDLLGSRSLACNQQSGQCNCLNQVTGLKCDECEAGSWNLTADVGCQECLCSDSSNGSNCHPTTGQCVCLAGVTGLDCSVCRDGYYNLRPGQGCLDCLCGLGALTSICSNTGACFCQEGVTGLKCDQCLPFHEDLSPSGCQECSECELSLNGQVHSFLQVLQEVGAEIMDFQLKFIQDQLMDLIINSNLTDLSVQPGLILNTLNQIDDNLQNINETDVMIIIQFTERTLAKATLQLLRTVEMLPHAQSVHRHVITVHNMMQDLFTDSGLLNLSSIGVKQSVTSYAHTANTIYTNVSMLSNSSIITNISSAFQGTVLHHIQSTRNELAMLLQWQELQQMRTNLISNQVSNITTILSMLKLEQILSLALLHGNSCSQFLNSSTSLQNDVLLSTGEIETLIKYANDSEYVLAAAESLLIVVQTDIQSLSSINSDLVSDLDSSGTIGTSGQGSVMSGMGDLRSENRGSASSTTEPDSAIGISGSGQMEATQHPPTAISSSLQSLATEIGQVESLILRWLDYLQESAKITQFFTFAETLNMTLLPALDDGNNAVNLILNYSDILDTLDKVFNVSSQISPYLENISTIINLSLHENSSKLIESVRNISGSLLELSMEESLRVVNIQRLLQRALLLADEAIRTADGIDAVRSALGLNLSSFSRNISLLRSNISAILSSLDLQIRNSVNLPADIQGALLVFITTSNRVVNQTRSSQEHYNLADLSLEDANTSLQTTSSVLDEGLIALEETAIIDLAATNARNLESLNASFSNLSEEVRRALAAAEMIDLALQFFGNSSLSYPIPSLSEDRESISMAVKPTHVNDGIILTSSHENKNESTVLEVTNGSLQLHCDQERILLENIMLDTDQWYQIFVTRDSEDIKLSLSSLPQNGCSYRGTSVLRDVTCSLLDGVAHLGGYGSSQSGFTGCIDRVIINNYNVPLFTPINRNVAVSACDLRPPLQHNRERTTGAWLLGGSSFIRINSVPSVQINFTIGLRFRTYDATGLLFVGFDDSNSQYLAVSLSNGTLEVHGIVSMYDRSLYLRSLSNYNSGSWHVLLLTFQDGFLAVTIDGIEVLSDEMSNMLGVPFLPTNRFYIGGLPEHNGSISSSVSTYSIAGCIDQFQIDNMTVDLSGHDSYRVDFDGCPDGVARGIRFNGEGGAKFNLEEMKLDHLSFGYRSTQLSSLLVQMNNLTVSIFHTKIKVSIFDTDIFSVASNLSDDALHTVTIDFVYTNESIVTLTVDGSSPVSASITTQYVHTGKINVGETTTEVMEKFRGCIHFFSVNGRLMNFSTAELRGVSLYGCYPSSTKRIVVTPPSAPPPPPPLPPPPSTMPPMTSVPIGLSGRGGTFLSFRVPEQAVSSSFSILLEFRSSSSDGLLIFMQDNEYLTDFLSLQLRSGRLLFSYNLGSGSANLESMDVYNDGFLHTVELVRSGRYGQMIIDDGLEVVSGLSNGTFQFLNARSEYLFIGGLSESFNRSRLRVLAPSQPYTVPVLACVSAFAINGVFENLSSPQAANDVESCLAEYNNLITLQDNSYIQFFDNFDVGVTFAFSINFITTRCSGLLLYVASSFYSDHLLVELRNGRVVLVFDNGPQLETLQYSGNSLCDGQWHSLRITKNEQKGSISVDRGEAQTVTSLCDSCAQFSATNTNSPLYIGGLPESMRIRHTIQSSSFQGCFSNFRISRGSEDYRSFLFSQAQDYSNVQFDVCSA